MVKKVRGITASLKKRFNQVENLRKSLINYPPTEKELLRRAILVKNQRNRRNAVKTSKKYVADVATFREAETARWKPYFQAIKDERKSRREDWLLGPLAPMRDSGDRKHSYGAVDPRHLSGSNIVPQDRMKRIPFSKGDRVVVVTGRERGKIGKIESINLESEDAAIEGVNELDMKYPAWFKQQHDLKEDIITETGRVPLRALRLIFMYTDPITNVIREAVAKDLELFDPEDSQNYVEIPSHYEERTEPLTGKSAIRFVKAELTRELTSEAREKFEAIPVEGEPYYSTYGQAIPKYTRFVKGTNIAVAWPASAKEEPNDEDVDTLRIEVEDRTIANDNISLFSPPFPGAVVKQLRNPYSRFRTRTDEDYLEKKWMEEAWKEWRDATRLVTPKKLLLDLEKEKNDRTVMRSDVSEMHNEQMVELGKMIESLSMRRQTQAPGRGARA